MTFTFTKLSSDMESLNRPSLKAWQSPRTASSMERFGFQPSFSKILRLETW